MKYKETFKEILIYAGILALFIILAYAFVPEVLSGKIINQSDTSAWRGMTHEISEHNAAHPEDRTLWTNSMFGGMPTVAMYDEFHGDWTNPLYKALLGGTRPASYLLLSLIGGFLLMLAFGVSKPLAVAGAIAITFCSYNLQIIQVGHNTKMQAIAFMPWVLSGIVFTYRSALEKAASKSPWILRTVLGSVLFAMALSFQIKANHPQITYYLAIIIFIYAITLFIWQCTSKERRKSLANFFVASALLLVVGGIGIATNLNKLIPTYKYTQYTMRGGSELTPDSDAHNDSGLDLDYATAWSYGIEETPNLLIPNFNGGASSGELKGRDTETWRFFQKLGITGIDNIVKGLPLYWGPQPFTAGPMYMGAITVFLFVLGLCLYRGKEKWWLLVATVLAVLLAWGSHFMWFTKLWYDYAPLYNKFRTVSMALVVLQVTLPVLGFIVLDRVMKGEYEKKTALKATGIAFGITAGFCLLCILFPGIAGTFRGATDQMIAGMMFGEGVDRSISDMLCDALAQDRKDLLVSDAWRSFALTALTAALLCWLLLSKNGKAPGKEGMSGSTKSAIAAGALCLMVLFDLWGVGKRYLNSSHFVSKRDFNGQFAQRPVDGIIKEDPELDYRVLDVSVNTFNDAIPSYHHKCIGGYSPAKLQRYQDLIERYISSEIGAIYRTVDEEQTISGTQENLPYLPIVSMLNGKYIILGGEYAPVINKHAFGNAWFVSSAVPAATPDDEIALIGQVNLRESAVIGDDFAPALQKIDSLSRLPRVDIAPADTICMSSYAPNELRYRYRSHSGQAVIFSEIFYPEGWTLTFTPDGSGRAVDIPLFRADWILRGAILPAGEGELVMRFDPPSYRLGESLSRASSITLLVLLLISCSGMLLQGKSKKKTENETVR